MRSGLYLLAIWVGFVGLWFLFVYELSLVELITGAAAAAVTVGALLVALRAVPLRFKPEAHWLSPVFTLPAVVVKDMFVLLHALARLVAGKKPRSLFQVTHFDAPAQGPHASARRVLAVAFTTVSPNSIVVGIDGDSSLLLFHELEKTPLPKILQELQN